MKNIAEQLNFKLLTRVSLGLMLVIMVWVSKDYGISGDEYTQNTYGEEVYKYFATFGEDKGALNFKNVYFYGGFYDLLCVTVNKILPTDDYNTRHFINAIFGFLAIFFTAKLARFYKGWGAAFVVAWFLFLSPRFFAESMNNPKDIPFALGMVMGVYFICRFVAAFPKPTKKDALWLALAIGYAIGIRVGGLLLIPFFFVALGLEYFLNWRKNYSLGGVEIKSVAIMAIVLSVIGYALGLVFWPFALEAPLSNPFKALAEMSQFSVNIRMLFDDAHIFSQFVPWYYVPKWLWMTTPVIILLGIIASPLLLARKSMPMSRVLFLFFVAIFPWAYIVYKHSPLYDGWRHLLFIYPFLVVISALTFLAVMDMLRNDVAKYAVTGLIVIGLILPTRWSVANHPNQIVYFNELQGGVDNAYGHYETDYYMNSIKQAIYKLAKEKDFYNLKDTVYIGTNCIEPMWHYVSTINPKLIAVYARYHQRYDSDYDYGIFYSRFIDKNLLQNGYFPPANTLFTINADNTPLAVVFERRQDEKALKAFRFSENKVYDSAAIYYQKAIQQDPRNETAYINYGIALANIGRVDEAIQSFNEALKANPEDLQAMQILVQLYQMKGDTQAAQNINNRAQAIIMEQQQTLGE